MVLTVSDGDCRRRWSAAWKEIKVNVHCPDFLLRTGRRLAGCTASGGPCK
jgi:hypothetical protein